MARPSGQNLINPQSHPDLFLEQQTSRTCQRSTEINRPSRTPNSGFVPESVGSSNSASSHCFGKPRRIGRRRSSKHRWATSSATEVREHAHRSPRRAAYDSVVKNQVNQTSLKTHGTHSRAPSELPAARPNHRRIHVGNGIRNDIHFPGR